MLSVHPEVHQPHHGQPHHHLQDLRGRDEHSAGPGHPQAGRSHCVVRVHEGVDGVVHGHEPAAAGHLVSVGEPGVDQHGDVVVPVKEDEALLPEDDERCVTCGWRVRDEGEKKSFTAAGREPGVVCSFTLRNDMFKY